MKMKLLSRTLVVLTVVILALSFSSCGKNETDETNTTNITNTYYAPQVLTNEASGKLVAKLTGGTIIDYSNTELGYVMVKYKGDYSNVRVQVTTPGKATPTYPIFSKDWEAIPLTGGNGTYKLLVAGNNGGTSYSIIGNVSIDVDIKDEVSQYLYPNLFCAFTTDTTCVNYAAELTRGCDTDAKKVEAIYNYMTANFNYDKEKANTVSTSAYIPDLEDVWASQSGICFDYSSTMAAMLRTQGIPTKICVGYANGNTYHAWLQVYFADDNKWETFDPTWGSNEFSYDVKYYY